MNNTSSKKTFLLGGYDLEMLTIKQMLEGHEDCDVLDKYLRWDNAFLSAYQEDIRDNDGPIYGIELREDIPVKANYHRIDHHNNLEGMPSALEQVADILGVQLNRLQRLIAANDKGYIPAMIALSATKEEIADIRRQDRKAQGISEEDEELAARSIRDNMSRHGSLLVVKSYTHHFSPICDALFPYKNLLIFTDTEWGFYGEGKTELEILLADEIKDKKIYHGGGEKGFIGAVKGSYPPLAILRFVRKIEKHYERI